MHVRAKSMKQCKQGCVSFISSGKPPNDRCQVYFNFQRLLIPGGQSTELVTRPFIWAWLTEGTAATFQRCVSLFIPFAHRDGGYRQVEKRISGSPTSNRSVTQQDFPHNDENVLHLCCPIHESPDTCDYEAAEEWNF